MTISELAGQAGIRPSRIRDYESVGVLPPPPRRSGARRYDDSAAKKLRSGLVAQRQELALADIRNVASGERDLADVAMEHALELGATIRRARVRVALLRHAAQTTTQLSAERYELILAKSEVLDVTDGGRPSARPFSCYARANSADHRKPFATSGRHSHRSD